MVSMRFALAVVAVSLGRSAVADIINVPADYATIQAAIDAAVDGDEVVVAPGTYNEAIQFRYEDITVRSSGGPEVTVLDGSGLPVCPVRFVLGVDPNSELRGFTITNGVGVQEGGYRFGGGIFMLGSATVVDCTLVGNSADYGGAVWSYANNPTFRECRFYSNVANHAAGVGLDAHHATLDRCVFIGNTASGGVGAILIVSPVAEVTDCIIAGNSAAGPGGLSYGPTAVQGSLYVERCTFVANENLAVDDGGTSEYLNCLFADSIGSAIRLSGGFAASMNITGCTFVHNGAHAIVTSSSSPPPVTIANSIFWANASGAFGGVAPTVFFSDVQGGWPGSGNVAVDPIVGSGPAGSWTAAPIVDALTGFVTLTDDGADFEQGALVGRSIVPDQSIPGLTTAIAMNTATTVTVVGEFLQFVVAPGDSYAISDDHLLPSSPCIDAASNAAVPPGTTTDLDGNPRFVDDPDAPDCPQSPGACGLAPVVDMGAYEVQPTVPCLTVLQESLDCDLSGKTFTWTVQGVNECTGAIVTVVFTGSADVPGGPACFSAEFQDSTGLCCEQTMCVMVPDCSGQPAEALDLDGDGTIGMADLLALLAAWGTDPGGPPDADGDGTVGMADLLALLANWG